MMDWFVLQPASIAALAECVLSIVLTLYLFSIKKKSTDTWLILAFVSASSVYYFIAFLFFSTPDFQQLQGSLFWAHQMGLAVMQLSVLPFAYYFKGNPFLKESRIVFILALVLTIITLYYHQLGKPFNYLFYMALLGWITAVLIRKAIIANATAHAAVKNKGAGKYDGRNKIKTALRPVIQVFTQPANRNVKAFRAFALWCILIFILWINVNLMGLNILPRTVWNPLHNTFILISLVWLVINYINYASELTTFLVKLVGLSLCSTLLLLGLMGFLLLGSSNNSRTTDATTMLRILVLLILISSAVIVVVFPLFYRRNLLQPLEQVLAGVQKVNAGDLQVKVPVEVNDEIGYLAYHFNLMTESLRNYAEEMENLVARRTQELERSLKELKATQTQLIQSEKMASLGELTAGIAHEIQNPLNFVNNFSEVSTELVEELKEGSLKALKNRNGSEVERLISSLSQNLQKINYHGRRADAIVKSMLLHSRKSTGEKELTDINKLIDEYLRLAYHGMRAKDKNFTITLHTDFDSGIDKISIVPQEIGRVLLNLFNNAFYAVQEKKRKVKDTYEPVITVSTKQFNGRVEITIWDNGLGIPQNVLDKIFQPFFTTKPTGQGVGLGLSLSYDIIKAHGGEIKVEPKEGEGAEFIIHLPYN
ncbi:MAG: ATP-binding protein, partial [Bacteroidota bacterium]|nr:ATP-binding protein [Bacteroidota bacterium]